MKHLKHISDADIIGLEIPTGRPWRFELDDELEVTSDGYLD